MQAARYIELLLCCLAFVVAPCQRAAATTFGKQDQSATIANFSLVAGDSLAGIRGLRLNFDVLMKLSGEQIFLEGQSSAEYNVIASFFDETGLPLAANPDVRYYRDPAGNLADTTRLVQGMSQQEFLGKSMFLPWYTIALLPGTRKIQVQLRVVEVHSKRQIGQSAMLAATIDMPALNRFRMEMKKIEVTEKDLKTDSWDYYFLNKREMLPDVRWSLMRGRSFLILTEKQKNSAIYTGDPRNDRTAWFTLAQGDRIKLTVQDFDLITFSDEIGTTMLDPWSPGFSSGAETEMSFDQVLSARFVLQRLEEPKMNVTGLVVQEGATEGGVTGTRLRFDYQLEYDIVGVRFVLKLRELLGESGRVPQFAWVVSGPAEKLEEGQFRLNSNSGEVELFIPWYGMAAKQEGRPARRMALAGEWRLDGQSFAMGSQQRELLRKAEPIKDFVFGQWTAGEVIRNGIAGLLFSCDYQLSSQYLRDLKGAEIRLYPEMLMQEGRVPPGYLQRIAPKNAKWQDDALLLTPEVDSSRLDLFMPYYMLPRHLPTLQLNLSYHAELNWEGRERPLGKFELKQEIELPRRIAIRIGVTEAGAKKERRYFSDPALEWRVYLGSMEVYRSRSIPHEKAVLVWSADELADLVLSEKDLIRVEVNRVAGGGSPQQLGEWEGRLDQLPPARKGLRKVDAQGLKKLTLSVEEVPL